MTAQVTDLNGNQSARATQLVTVAETGPSVTIDKVDGNDRINFAEDHQAACVALTCTVTGHAAGSLVDVMVADNGVTKSTYIATVNEAGTGWTATIPTADASALHDGTATVTAQVTDLNGNQSALATQLVTVLAETGPSVTIDKVDGNDLINFAEAHAAAGVALTGTVTGLAAGNLFNVMVADNGVTNTYIATVNDAGTGLDRHHPDRGCVEALHDGTATVTAQVTDLNGNQSALATQLVTVAETGPSVTIDKVDGNDLINFAEAHAAAGGVALTGTVTGLAAGGLFNVDGRRQRRHQHLHCHRQRRRHPAGPPPSRPRMRRRCTMAPRP